MKKFDQYVSHLRILSRAFDEDLTNDFIVSGIIDKYYIQFELGWKVLKELLRYEGAARQLVNKVLDSYIHEFQVLEMKIKERYSDEVLSSIN